MGSSLYVGARRSFLDLTFIFRDASPQALPPTHITQVEIVKKRVPKGYPSLRKLPADRFLRNVIHEDGGPLIHNGSEEEQRSLDSTCRKFHRFLGQPQL
jgi:hypothetical protein